MPAESATTIAGLNENAPGGDEPVSEGYEHLQLLKDVLKRQFTGGATGLDAAVTVTAAEFNSLAGIRTDVTIQAQLDAITAGTELPAPPNTKMLFGNAVIPTGWSPSQDPDDVDRLIRIVTTNDAGTVGGDASPLTPFIWAHNHGGSTGGHSLSESQIPSHYHHVINNSNLAGNVSDLPSTANYIIRQHSGGAEFAYEMRASDTPASRGRSSSVGGSSTHSHTISTDGDGQAFHLKYYNARWYKKD
jgi:hypothetical protein